MRARSLASEREAVGRAVLDVSELPTEVFGNRNVAWWATVAFMIIEGTTLILAMASYLYLRPNFTQWPPPGYPLPRLAVPTASLLVLLAECVPFWLAARAAKVMDLRKVRFWLVITTIMSMAVVVLRAFEFRALGVSYRDNVYGSLCWLILGMHSTLVFVDFFEGAVIAAMMFRSSLEPKHFVDVDDAADYKIFLGLSMVPIYLLLYWSPRWF
jgi:heme/copper-type cytochrome/quinol oxidase subunit 3